MANTISLNVITLKGEDAGTVEVSAEVFGVKDVNPQVVKNAVTVYQANLRQATAKTKKRHEVHGTNKKPGDKKEPAALVRATSNPRSGSAAASSSDRTATKTTAFPRTRRNTTSPSAASSLRRPKTKASSSSTPSRSTRSRRKPSRNPSRP